MLADNGGSFVDRRQGRPNKTRTDAILDALKQNIEHRRALIDGAEDLGEIQITVRLNLGTTQVRSVNVSEERVVRRV